MRKFETVSLYDSEIGEWVEFYKIDGVNYDPEEYFEEMDLESEEIEEDEDEECDEDCRDCEFFGDCDDESDDSLDEEVRLIGEYLESILSTEGCPDCIIKILCDFASTFKEIGRQNAIDQVKDFVEFIDE